MTACVCALPKGKDTPGLLESDQRVARGIDNGRGGGWPDHPPDKRSHPAARLERYAGDARIQQQCPHPPRGTMLSTSAAIIVGGHRVPGWGLVVGSGVID